MYMVTPPPPPRQTPEVHFRSVQEGGGGKSTTPKFLEFPKIQKPKKTQPKFRIFGNSRNLLKIQKIPKFLEFPKIQKSKMPTPISDFWKLEEFAQNPKKSKIPRVSKNPKIPTPSEFWVFLDFEQIPRVSKNPKLGLGFLDFWILETRGISGFFGF